MRASDLSASELTDHGEKKGDTAFVPSLRTAPV